MKNVVIAKGFKFAGIHAGIKVERKDLALVVTDEPATAAGVFTRNECRAACVRRAESLLPWEGTRAIVVNSGNANAMSGADEVQNDRRMATAVAKALQFAPEQVVTASTGSIGDPLPIDIIEAAVPRLVESLVVDVHDAAEAILTTDRVTKLASRRMDIAGTTVTITAIAKGSGMIHPNMATMLAFLCTDAACAADELKAILSDAADATFNQISVDRDSSTNDMVLLLANGASGVDVDSRTTAFVTAINEICEELAREIASDGEGATRLLSVRVSGAPDLDTARKLSRSAVASNLFKASLYGDNSGWGRCMAAIGARAAVLGLTLERSRLAMTVNGVTELENGQPTGLKASVAGPEVAAQIDLGLGDASACAWGCDLSYDYVTINAVSKTEPLDTHSPGLKRRLLVECLAYIRRFAGGLAVIKYGGAAMLRDDLKDAFAEDLVLLRAAGLLPVVVHGGGPEISQTLERLGEQTSFIDGMRVTDSNSMKVVEMVLTGSVNTDVVTRIHKFRGSAVGLSGKDGNLLLARKLLKDGQDLGMVGEVERVQTEVIELLLNTGYIPVISPVGVDAHGVTLNVNADSVAAAIAVALKAEKLIFLTDVPGILEGEDVLSQASPQRLSELLETGVVKGGMVPKVTSLLSAVEHGVHSAHIIDGRVPHNLLAELFTEKGVGTWVTRGDEPAIRSYKS